MPCNKVRTAVVLTDLPLHFLTTTFTLLLFNLGIGSPPFLLGIEALSMAASAPLNTSASLVSTFGSFLTVAIHTILYERSIYPEASFLSARKYNFPVRQSRHPGVCSWINDAVAAVEAELLKV